MRPTTPSLRTSLRRSWMGRGTRYSRSRLSSRFLRRYRANEEDEIEIDMPMKTPRMSEREVERPGNTSGIESEVLQQCVKWFVVNQK